MSQAPAVSRPVSPPAAPPGGAGGPGMGNQLLQMLPALLGGMSSRGGPAFMRGMQQARQEQAQQQQLAGQAEDRQFNREVREQQLAMRQQEAEQKALLANATAWKGVQAFLADPAIDTPEAYDEREREALATWQALGKDPGAIVSLRKVYRTPERFTSASVRAERAIADGVVENFSKIHGDMAKAIAESGDGRGPQVTATKPNGQAVTRSLADWMTSSSQYAKNQDGTPYAPKKAATVADTAEEQFYQRFAEENNAPSFQSLSTKQQAAARKQWMQADDRPLAGGTGSPAGGARSDARIDRVVASFNAHPIVKEYNETQSQQGIIRNLVAGQWSGPGDMAVVFAFMKALDPNSVVRETEYDNAAKSGNIFAGWAARFNGGLNPSGGFLSEQVRKDFLKTINARMSVKGQQYDNLRKQLVARVDRIRTGAPETGDEALVDYAAGGEAGAGTEIVPVGGKVGRFERVK